MRLGPVTRRAFGLGPLAFLVTGIGPLAPPSIVAAQSAAVTVYGASPFDSIDADGWVAMMLVPNESVGETFDPTKIVLTVQDPGYDGSGNATTVTRTIRGGAVLRRPWPNHATQKIAASGSNLEVYFSLDGQIYQGSTITAAEAEDDFYGLGPGYEIPTITNGSTRAYRRPVANWACTPYQRAGSGGFEFEVYASHRHVRNGRTVAAVKCTVTDGAAATSTGITAAMVASNQVAEAEPYALVYRVAVPTTGLADGAGTAKFTVYPWIGDSTAIFDSTVNGLTWPTPQPASFPVCIDVAGNHTPVYACLDTASGNDGTGVTSATRATAEASPYATFTAAAAALKSFNNGRGHNDMSGAVILLTQNIAGFGADLGTTTYPEGLTWWTVALKSGTTAKTVGITPAGTAANKRIQTRMAFKDLLIEATSNTNVLDGVDDAAVSGLPTIHARFENCKVKGITAVSTPPLINIGLIYTVGSAHENGGASMLKPFSNRRTHWALMLGSTASATEATKGATPLANVYTMIGCTFSGVSFQHLPVATSNAQSPDGSITACNKFLSCGKAIEMFGGYTWTIGSVFEQNVVEATNGTAQPAITAGVETSTSTVANAILRYNTLAGERLNVLYDNNASTSYVRKGVCQYNLFQIFNIKSDVFTSAVRTGNWEPLFGVGFKGNHYVDPASGSSGGASPTAPGVGSWLGEYMGPRTTNNVDVTFTSDKSDGGDGLGGGNYVPTGTVTTLLSKVAAGEAGLPLDLAGNVRKNDGTGACGAYEIA